MVRSPATPSTTPCLGGFVSFSIALTLLLAAAIVWAILRRRSKGRQGFGHPEEVADLSRRNAAFLGRSGSLTGMLLAAFEVEVPMENPNAAVVYGLGRLSVEDFFEMLTLCREGYGYGAQKLLRGLYERVVTARHLTDHPDETDYFLAWGLINEGKGAREELRVMRDRLPAHVVAELEGYVEAGKAALKRTIKCDKCRAERPSFTWSRLPLTAMAEHLEGLGDLIFPCYYEPMRHLHPSPASLDGRLLRDGKAVVVVPGPSRPQADLALQYGHRLMLEVGNLLLKRFQPNRASEIIHKAVDDYLAVWGATKYPINIAKK